MISLTSSTVSKILLLLLAAWPQAAHKTSIKATTYLISAQLFLFTRILKLLFSKQLFLRKKNIAEKTKSSRQARH
ncbi:hypothetical protein A9Q85_08130 [Cycloclasticus sp. 44_32_T64]|nr:hypothetical protein A9Q85_08130 [Cycloclasticus sp. 44_32_T64]